MIAALWVACIEKSYMGSMYRKIVHGYSSCSDIEDLT